MLDLEMEGSNSLSSRSPYDFIFAILGEEMGLIATMSVVILFLAMFVICMLQLRRTFVRVFAWCWALLLSHYKL